MEAALRSAYFLATGTNCDADAFKAVRGLNGWKEATFDLAGTPLRVAVASGLGNANRLLTAVEAGEVVYDFVEVMACPGGCAGGADSRFTMVRSSRVCVATCSGDLIASPSCAAVTRTLPFRRAIATTWASRSPIVPSSCSIPTTMHGRCLARSREEAFV